MATEQDSIMQAIAQAVVETASGGTGNGCGENRQQ